MNTGTAPKCLRGQGSAEFLLILAAALFVIAVSFYISSQQFTSVSQSKNVNDATLTADSIASAA
ncbi:MAG: class III signal peptide-containing protein, partial [Candidatus Micrarchaeia archaeon]